MQQGHQQDEGDGDTSEHQPKVDREPSVNASRREEVHERETGERQSYQASFNDVSIHRREIRS
jgi:hypothetical protein